jgi:hypothetical protein
LQQGIKLRECGDWNVLNMVLDRLELTLKAGLALPRLEQLIAKLGLSSFERDTLILLVGFTLSPVLQKALKKEFGRGLMVRKRARCVGCCL